MEDIEKKNGNTSTAKQEDAEHGLTFVMLNNEARGLEGTSDLVGLTQEELANATLQKKQEHTEGVLVTGVIYTALPFKNKGHLINIVYLVLASILVIILGYSLRPDNNSALCPAYLSEVLPLALILDFVIAQPLIMILSYMYQWMVSDPENGQPIKLLLHPRDCLVRDEFEEEEEILEDNDDVEFLKCEKPVCFVSKQ